jgi:hypothetical protein
MKKHHWHVFWHEKLFKKHPQPHCQTRLIIFGRPLRCGKASSMLFFSFFSFFFPSLSFLFCVKNKTWHQRRSEEAMGIYLLVNKYRIEEIGRGFFGTDLGLEKWPTGKGFWYILVIDFLFILLRILINKKNKKGF